MIVAACNDPFLRETDLRRYNLKRATLQALYEFLTAQIKEAQHERLVQSVEAVENLWGHGMEDVADRESFAHKFDDSSSRTAH